MYGAYTLVLALGLVLTAPYYLARFRKYGPSFRERLGFVEAEPGKATVWVHAVSVGEVRAVGHLIEGLRRQFSQHRMVVSTTTATGRALVGERSDIDRVVYFPLDLPGTVRRSLDRLRPDLVIVAETEIWPNFVRECNRRGIPVFLVNGRISDSSFRRYRRVRRWLATVLEGYRLLGMQSESDADRIRQIGAPAGKVAVFGNLKYDFSGAPGDLDPQFRDTLKCWQPLMVAASTTSGEEPLVLEAFRQLHEVQPNLKLLVAPRHPERFSEVSALIESAGFSGCRRSRLSLNWEKADVLLLDTIGELSSVFEYATLVFMGGSLVPRGGHNVLEPALFSKPVVFGPHMENFRDIARLFVESKAAIQVADVDGLVSHIRALLDTPVAAAQMGRNARRLVEENAGATGRFLEAIRASLLEADTVPHK